MKFKLPNSRELSDDQNKIIQLRTNRSWVVQGSPGTGKSVMALFRAAQISEQIKDGQKVLILVYNKPLQMYIETALNDSKTFRNCQAMTYFSWLWRFFDEKKIWQGPYRGYPKTDSKKIDPDWSLCMQKVKEYVNRNGKCYHHVIIDEAQDFPVELVRILSTLTEYMTCFIDPNQTLTPGKTDTTIALRETCTESDCKLRENFRNSQPISSLSEIYWNGEGVLAKATRRGSKPRMIKVDSDEERISASCAIIQNNRQKNIGIIVNQQESQSVYRKLREQLPHNVDIELYVSKSNSNQQVNEITPLNFNTNAVKVVTFGTMKGLEFDLVLIPYFDSIDTKNDPKTDLNRMYVAITRACTELFMMYQNESCGYGKINPFTKLSNNKGLVEWTTAKNIGNSEPEPAINDGSDEDLF